MAYRNRDRAYCDKDDYGQVIELDPEYASAYSGRAWAYYEKGDNQQALADFEMCLALGATGTMKEDAEEMIGELQ